MRNTVIIGFIFISLATFLLFTLTNATSKTELLTFSNTQVWDAMLLEKSTRKVHFVPDWKSKLLLPPPPKNTSAETVKEIKTLLSYKKERTVEKIDEIKKQDNFDTIIFGDQPMKNYFNSALFPETYTLLKISFEDITTIELAQKRIFDRVRPSFLESEIDPVIPVPEHAAYPSGHSTQIHFMAYILSELIPEKENQFFREASLIAKNREIAGVHYPSDTEAGKKLAKNFWEKIINESDFKAQLEKAKVEWNTNNTQYES